MVPIVIVCVSLCTGLFCFCIGLDMETKARTFRGFLMALGLVMMLLPTQQLLFAIQYIPADEETVAESRPIAAGGVSVEVAGRWGTYTRYVVMAEEDDGTVAALTLPASSVTVYEDVSSWEDARIDKTVKTTWLFGGTFFGVPVEDAWENGPYYRLHVPEASVQW